jgi:hypothetical protein
MFESRMVRAALGAVALGGALITWSVPANAGASTGTWRNGMVAGPYGGGYYGRPAFGGYRGGYRPAYGGYYGGYRPYYRRNNVGGAVAAGVIGGLALGALATAPYRYSYPATYGGYYGAGYYGAPACYMTTQRGVDAWGRVVLYRTQVCE